jgi:hypothetical protein
MLRACSDRCRYLPVTSKRCYCYVLNKCGRCAVTRNITAPVSTHKPRTCNFTWAPFLQSNIDTHRVMVNTDTSILITSTNLNNFRIKMNSVFNTISEWFMVNSLFLYLNKTFHGIKVFRMHKYIIRIMMSCKKIM